MEKEETAGYQHFLLFQQYFTKSSFSRSLTPGFVLKDYEWFGEKSPIDLNKFS